MMEGLITTIDQIRSEVIESRQVLVCAAGRASAALVCDTERHLHGVACIVRCPPRRGPAATPLQPASGCEGSTVGRLERAAPPSVAAGATYLQTLASWQAAASAFWVAAVSLLATNELIVSTNAWLQPSLIAA